MFRLQFIFFLLLATSTAAQQPKLTLPTGHGISINDMALSHDGKYVATASADRTVILWETETGRQIYTLTGHTASADNVWFSKDDKKILSASLEEHTFFIWDKETGTLLSKTTLEGGTLTQIKISERNNNLYATDFEGHISCYDLNTQKKKFRIKGHKSIIQTIEFSTDESKLIVASDDGVKEWSAADGKLLREFPIKSYMVFSARYSTDNKKILISFKDTVGKNGEKRNLAMVKIFDAVSGKFLEEITGDETRFEVQYAANGSNRIIQDYYNSSMTLLNIQSGDTLFTTPVSYRSFGFTGNEKKDPLYTINNNELTIRDALTGKKISSTSLPFQKVSCVKPVMNGTCLLIASGENGMSVLQEIKTGKEKIRFTGQSFLSYYPKFSPDGNFIYNLSTDFTVKKWNKSTGKLDRVFKGHNDLITYHRLLKQENRMLTVGLDGAAIVWDTRLSAPLFTLTLPEITESDKFSLNGEGTQMMGRRLINRRFIRLWDIENGTDHKDILAPGTNIRDIALSQDGKKIAVTSYDTVAYIIDVATGNVLLTSRHPGVEGSNLCFSPDSKRLLFFNWHGTFVMDVATGNMLGQTNIRNESLMPGKYSADGTVFITQSPDSTIHVWRSSDISRVSTLRFTDGVPILSFFDNRNRLITQSSDNITRLWDVQTGKVLQTYKGPMGADVNRTADTLVTAYNNEWMLYSMVDGKLLYKSLIMGDDNLVLDEKGRYDGNAAARKLVYLTCGTEIVELDQVKDQLWIPNLAERLLRQETIGSKTIDELGICDLTPKVERIQNNGNAYQFKITPRRGGLGETILYVNGIEFGRYKQGQLKQTATGYELLVEKESLTSFFITGQENTVTAKAYTADNGISSRGTVITSDEKKTATAPNLFAVLVGVSDYKGDELDLKFAAKDAIDISNAVSNASRKLLNTDGKEHVFVYNLTTSKERDQLPEKKSIKKVMEEIGKKATANDILLLFFAGHGVMEGEQKQFYFLTADASSLAAGSSVAEVGISTTELTDWMKPQSIKAQKRILIFDACNSGQAIKDFVKMGSNNQNYLAARNDDQAQQIKAIDKLNEKSGLFILSASASNQSAYEMGRYSQGLLTYSLLKAIKQQPDILENGKFLNVSRWFNAAEKTVSELAKETGGRQEPQIVTNTNFNIGIVDNEVMAKIILPTEKPLFAASNFQNSDEAIADDDLEVSKLINLQLSDMAVRGADSKILYVTATNSPDAYSLSGRYTAKGSSIVITVNLKQNKTIKSKFELTGSKDKLTELAAEVATKAADLIK